jgi:hypothetical protein
MINVRTPALAAALAAGLVVPAFAQPSGSGAPSGQAPQAQGAPIQQGAVSDAMVHKVGAALRQTVTIRQKYAERAQSQPKTSTQDQQALATAAESEMVQAISDQGLSVQQYNQVIQMAQADPALKQRLLSAAQSGG